MAVVVPLEMEMQEVKDQELPVVATVAPAEGQVVQPIPVEVEARLTRELLAAVARVLWWRVIWARVLRGPVDRSPPAPAVQAVTRYTPSPLQAR